MLGALSTTGAPGASRVKYAGCARRAECAEGAKRASPPRASEIQDAPRGATSAPARHVRRARPAVSGAKGAPGASRLTGATRSLGCAKRARCVKCARWATGATRERARWVGRGRAAAARARRGGNLRCVPERGPAVGGASAKRIGIAENSEHPSSKSNASFFLAARRRPRTPNFNVRSETGGVDFSAGLAGRDARVAQH